MLSLSYLAIPVQLWSLIWVIKRCALLHFPTRRLIIQWAVSNHVLSGLHLLKTQTIVLSPPNEFEFHHNITRWMQCIVGRAWPADSAARWALSRCLLLLNCSSLSFGITETTVLESSNSIGLSLRSVSSMHCASPAQYYCMLACYSVSPAQ